MNPSVSTSALASAPTPNTATATVSSKQELIDIIREWFQLETEMETLRKELNIRQKRKRVIDETLNKVFEQPGLKEGINIPTKKGKLVQVVEERKKPITKKMLISRIQTFFQEHAPAGVPNMSDNLTQHLLSQREIIRKKKIEFEVIEDTPLNPPPSASAPSSASEL